LSKSAKRSWPYIGQTLDDGGQLMIATEGYGVVFSALLSGRDTVCMIKSDGISFDKIMNRLEELAQRYHEEGIVTDEVNDSEYSAW
jgi:hypothetical protein